MLLRSANVRVFDTAARSSGCRLNAYRIDETFHIDIDLPGVDPAGIDVTADEKVVTVRAARKHAGGETGPVSRHVLLPDPVDTDRLDARYEDGVLTLRIPVSAGTAAS